MPEAEGIAALGVGLVFLAITFTIFVFFLLNLQKALKLAGEENASMAPALVWLNIIPIFNLGWMIFTVLKVSEAISNKHQAHGIEDASNGAKQIGLIYSICAICSIIPVLGFICSLVSIVCGIIYWVKVAGYNKAMQQMA